MTNTRNIVMSLHPSGYKFHQHFGCKIFEDIPVSFGIPQLLYLSLILTQPAKSGKAEGWQGGLKWHSQKVLHSGISVWQKKVFDNEQHDFTFVEDISALVIMKKICMLLLDLLACY